MFSIKKATFFAITALTSIGMTGIFSSNSAQAAISNYSELALNANTLNSQTVTENSFSIKLPIEKTEVISLKRGMVICKPGSVKPHTRNSCKKTNNNKPASVTKPANQSINNNKPVPATNSPKK